MYQTLTDWVAKLGESVAKLTGDYTPKGLPQKPDRKSANMLVDCQMLSSLLPYETYDVEASLFVNQKSIGFVLETTTLIGSSEEIENILSSIITDTLPDTADLQFLLWASPKIEPILNAFRSHRTQIKTEEAKEIFEWLATKRIDYLKKGVSESLTGFGTHILRDFRLFIVVSMPKKQGDAKAELIQLRDDLESSLQSINMFSQRLNARDLVNLLRDIIIPSQSLSPDTSEWSELDSLAMQLTDPEWRMDVYPNSLLFSSDEEAVDVRCLTVREFPQKVTQWKVTENIGQIFNATLQIPCPFLVSFSLRKMDRDKAISNMQITSLNRESTAKSQLAKFKPSVNKEYEEWQFVKSRLLGEGDSLVKTFYQVILFSKPEQANANERRVRDLYRANGWKLRKESYLQLQTWLAALPMTMTEGMFHDLKYFGRIRTMTAFNAVNVAPLQGEWQGTKTPGLLFAGRRGQLASWDPFDNEGNFNIVMMAAPRKGKSALTNEYIVSVLGAGGRVWVIDVGRSYEKTCKVLGGQFIEFTPTTQICVNPFTFITDIDESIDLLQPLLASMARPQQNATDEELSFLEKACKGAWQRKKNAATITTVAEWLNEQSSQICKNLSHLLYRYTAQGIYARFFEGECTVNFQNPLIVMELQDLDAKKDLRRVVLQVLIYLITQSMYLGERQQIKSCIIDEAWDLFDSDNIATAKFIEAGYRKAPKHRGNFISIAHSIEDFRKNAMSQAAFRCADFKIILGQTDEAVNELKKEKTFELDGFTERLFKSLKITKDFSECVIKSPQGLSIFRIIFDPYSRILYSTKGEEFEAVNRLVNSGMPLTQAIEQIARKFNYV